MTLGKLPAGGAVLPGFVQGVQITGLSQSASVAAGLGARAPSASVVGTLTTWDGAAATSPVNLATVTTPTVRPVNATASYTTSPGNAVTVNVRGSVTALPSTVTASMCTSTTCSGESGGVSIDLTYTIAFNGATLESFVLSGDLCIGWPRAATSR